MGIRRCVLHEDSNVQIGFVELDYCFEEIELLEYHLMKPSILNFESFARGTTPGKFEYHDPKMLLKTLNHYISGIKKKQADCFGPKAKEEVLGLLGRMVIEAERAIENRSQIAIDWV